MLWHAPSVNAVLPPRIEGTIPVAPGRRLGFSEFGPHDGRPVFWFHGTPGARRQVPAEARAMAWDRGLRIIGIDRPGIGSSTPHGYRCVLDFAADMDTVMVGLGIDRFAVVALSGGGPYALALARQFPDRAVGIGVLGGVAPTVGADATEGGAVALARRFAPAISAGRVPLAATLAGVLRVSRPFANQAIALYGRMSPEGDRLLLEQPAFKAMFIDDLLNGSRRQISAPIADLVLFGRHWGFEVGEVEVPVRWWHGDADHIVPHAHGEHTVARIPDARLLTLPGQSHLGGLGVSEEVLDTLLDLWPTRSPGGASKRVLEPK